MSEENQVVAYIKERFGIEASNFKDFEFYRASKGRIFLGPKGFSELPSTVSVGVLVARISKTVKPSTNMLQIFGRHATKNVVKLSKGETVCFVRGEDIRLTEKTDATDGYVVVNYLDIPLGCGLLRGEMLMNMIPKAKRAGLKFL